MHPKAHSQRVNSSQRFWSYIAFIAAFLAAIAIRTCLLPLLAGA